MSVRSFVFCDLGGKPLTVLITLTNNEDRINFKFRSDLKSFPWLQEQNSLSFVVI